MVNVKPEPAPVFEPLSGSPPKTASGGIGCVMLVKPNGQDQASQWFEFRSTVFSDVVRYAWDLGTSFAVFPVETANLLIKKGYARLMTEAEVKVHNEETKP